MDGDENMYDPGVREGTEGSKEESWKDRRVGGG